MKRTFYISTFFIFLITQFLFINPIKSAPYDSVIDIHFKPEIDVHRISVNTSFPFTLAEYMIDITLNYGFDNIEYSLNIPIHTRHKTLL